MIINAKVKPNSEKFEIREGSVWTISLKSPAENNKANIELIKEMTKRYGKCKIIKGTKSKSKVLEI